MICTFCLKEITREEVIAHECTVASIDEQGNYELCHNECLEEQRLK